MVPIPETVRAIDDLDPVDALVFLAELGCLADLAQEVVPDLVGVSIARLDHGLTFTLVATAEEIAVLDAIQYLAGGPCVDAAHLNLAVEFDNDDALDEDRWRLFAQATAAHAVRTTLTLPVMTGGHVVGTVNLYAASQRAFGGHHDELAEIFAAWAAGAVANADLAFTTRREAQAAPDRVARQFVIAMATRLTAAQHVITFEAAEALLRDAALRAGVSLSQLALEIVAAHEEQDPGETDRI
jgi:GAF domain-containing protein